MLLLIVSLIFCVITHELAHLLVAKLVKCKVEIFSIGFGKVLFSFIYKGTKYQIALIPLGGYCKLSGDSKYSRSKYAFLNLRYIHKSLIVIAGCVINILIGITAICIGWHLKNFNIYYFGGINAILGLSNMLPIPCLDGSYLIFPIIYEKLYGKKKGYEKLEKLNKFWMIILIALNLACIPYIIFAHIKLY